jgi:hypothetical protein
MRPTELDQANEQGDRRRQLSCVFQHAATWRSMEGLLEIRAPPTLARNPQGATDRKAAVRTRVGWSRHSRIVVPRTAVFVLCRSAFSSLGGRSWRSNACVASSNIGGANCRASASSKAKQLVTGDVVDGAEVLSQVGIQPPVRRRGVDTPTQLVNRLLPWGSGAFIVASLAASHYRVSLNGNSTESGSAEVQAHLNGSASRAN